MSKKPLMNDKREEIEIGETSTGKAASIEEAAEKCGVVLAPEPTADESALLKKLMESHKLLAKDKLQDEISLGEYITTKLNMLKRLQDTQVKRVQSEIPKETAPETRALMLAAARVYEAKMVMLKNVLKMV